MDEIVGRLRVWGERARAWAARRGLSRRHGAAAGGVLLGAVVVIGLANAASGERRAGDMGERLQIEIVQPVEPVFTAGPTMEVGTLVDGFDPGLMPVSAPPDAITDDPGPIEEDAKSENSLLRRFSSAVRHIAPRENPSSPRIRREDRAYGFDAPGPDLQAEREARRAWRDQIEAERRADHATDERYESERRKRREPDRRMDEPARGGVKIEPVG